MDPTLPDESKFYFDHGGPIRNFFHGLAHRWGIQFTVLHRIIGFLLITWVPLFLFALLEGRALAATPKESFLLDFGTYARFFLAVPLLIVAELIIGSRLRQAGLQFVHGGFVRPDDYSAFAKAVAAVAKGRDSLWAELIILGLALIGPWWFTTDALTEGLSTWRAPTHATSSGSTISFTGLWYRIIALPVLQFFWYRWLWRLFLWSRFLWTMSRLNLNLVATHADKSGGLGFLGTAHMSLGIIAFAMSSILCAEVAFLIVFEHTPIEAFKASYIALLILVAMIFLGPLFLFMPILARTRLVAERQYSLLLDQYNRAFHNKWVEGEMPKEEPILGSADIQSLADLGNSFNYVQGMTVLPFSIRQVIQLAIVTSLPCLPLVLLVVPVGKIFEMLAKVVV